MMFTARRVGGRNVRASWSSCKRSSVDEVNFAAAPVAEGCSVAAAVVEGAHSQQERRLDLQ
jgi:hypothetical protein